MSDVSMPESASQPKKSGKLTSIVILVCAVIAIISGIAKMKSGLSELFGGLDSKAKQLLEESDAAGQKALESAKAGDAKFDALIQSVNGKTLDELRKDDAATVAEARKSLSEAADGFRAASAKIGEALKIDVADKVKQFMTLKSAMYASYAEAYDHKVEVIGAIVDETVKDRDALVAKMNDLSAKADAAFKAGNESSAKADAIAKGGDAAKDSKDAK